MIKFFKRIRQQLLSQNKFSKYMLYAIGEIVLVVIGILIALSINNWNDNRQNRKLEYKALVNLRNEFEMNKSKLEFIHIKARENKDRMSVFSEYLRSTTYFQSEGFNTNNLRKNHTNPCGLKTFNPVGGVIKSLISSGQINMIQKDSLKYLLTSWSEFAEDFKEDNEMYLNWWNTSFMTYANNLPPFTNEYSSIVKDEKWVLNQYVKAYTDYKYWKLIGFAEFQLFNKENTANELIATIDRILKFLDEEIALKSK